MRELARELGMAVAAPRASQGEKRMTFYTWMNESELESDLWHFASRRQDQNKITIGRRQRDSGARPRV